MSETKLILNIFPVPGWFLALKARVLHKEKNYLNEHFLSPFLLDTSLQKRNAVVFPQHGEKNNALFWIL